MRRGNHVKPIFYYIVWSKKIQGVLIRTDSFVFKIITRIEHLSIVKLINNWNVNLTFIEPVLDTTTSHPEEIEISGSRSRLSDKTAGKTCMELFLHKCSNSKEKRLQKHAVLNTLINLIHPTTKKEKTVYFVECLYHVKWRNSNWRN